MSWTNLSITAAMATAVLVLLPVGSAAPAVITGGVNACVFPLPVTNPDNGSCNLVFRNEHDLAGLTTAELVETVKQSCPGFPNGPYQRSDSPIDYVTLELSTPTTGEGNNEDLDGEDINDQIGTELDVNVNLSVLVDGTFTNNGANITINDTSDADRQILDLGGFDFVLFEKSQGGGGGQRGTLVCDINMWYRVGDNSIFGLQNFGVDHGVNQITIGWVAGPSGHFSQANAVDACAAAEGPGLEQSVSYLVGSYKSTTNAPVSIINVTGCGLDAPEGDPVLTAYCDAGEAAGGSGVGEDRPNACNPDGATGGLPDVTSSGVSGSASTCYFSSRGTLIAFRC